MQFKCPKCSWFLTMDEKYAGQSGPCPHCGQLITVPQLRARPAAPVLGPVVVTEQPKPKQRNREDQKVQEAPAVGSHSNEVGSHSSIDAVALFFAVLLAVACWLPWIQLETLFVNRGIENHDGALVLVLSIAAGAIAISNISAKRNRLGLLYAIIGLVALTIAAFDLMEAFERSADVAGSFDELSSLFGIDASIVPWRFVGSGLYIVLASALGLMCVGIISCGRSIRRR